MGAGAKHGACDRFGGASATVMTTAEPPIETAAAPGAAPVRAGERIAAIDVLRGFAVLGILAMNVQSYSMVSAAYLNPAANDKLAGAGFSVWVLTHVFFDTKFMSIFSTLFGAGMALMAERAASRGASATGVHYRRQFWLLLLGLAHAHLIWYGDILVPYALCGFLLYSLRGLKPRKLVIAGFAMTAVTPVFFLLAASSIPNMPAEARDGLERGWAPPAAEVEAEIATYQSGWLTQLPEAQRHRHWPGDHRFPAPVPLALGRSDAGRHGVVPARRALGEALVRVLPAHGRGRTRARPAGRGRRSDLQHPARLRL